MNWSDLATKVADAAPILGTLLGGPQGALVGSWIAKKFGTEGGDPSQVLETLNKDAEWQFKLRELEVEREKEILSMQTSLAMQEMTLAMETLKSVNTTMQVESSSDKWWVSGWRPFIGFVFGGSFAYVTVYVCYLLYLAVSQKDANAMASIPTVVSTFTTLFGIPGAILGVTAWGRNHLKLKQLESQTQ